MVARVYYVWAYSPELLLAEGVVQQRKERDRAAKRVSGVYKMRHKRPRCVAVVSLISHL
jgi:hypothetical protein